MIFNMNGVNVDTMHTDDEIKTLASSVGTQIKTGSFTGNGATNRKISVGFTPKAVFVFCTNDTYRDNAQNFGLAVTSSPQYDNADTKEEMIKITTSGFYVSETTISYMNNKDLKFNYIAFA